MRNYYRDGITALPLVILIGGIVLEITVAFALVAFFLFESGGGSRYSSEALSLSNSGIQDALMKITRNEYYFPTGQTSYSVYPPVNGQINMVVCRNYRTITSACDTSYVPSDIFYEITATGKVFGKNRTLRARVNIDSKTGSIAIESIKET